ncbi:hypothetical protein [Oceanobacillus iheyensis HTE831]|uniref:Lipoprotein n=1 Tax=Oceanobacillus iheyensis (strain DSM 14371 / CIP 107618 / JCM 11309 / KCTC 3954 / HTE831) TaxID=221109 RepID=Q8CUX1_OCEIH|nr:hypothetical protein [Oceanobacillus iheyensis]BAC12942.1 hypothetical protein [Oceanobacillus iheyensis HTE831]
MKKRSMFLFFIFFLGACNTATESESYQSMIRIHNTNYYYLDDATNYSQSVKIGEIKEQTPPDVMPVRHLRSNSEPKGSEIYSTKESSNHIIVRNIDTDDISVYTSEENNLSSTND